MSELMKLASAVLDHHRGSHGQELWRHPARFEAYLRDYAGHNIRLDDAESALLLAVLRGGCLAELADQEKKISLERVSQVREGFMRKQGLPPASINSAFASWAPVLGIDLPKEEPPAEPPTNTPRSPQAAISSGEEQFVGAKRQPRREPEMMARLVPPPLPAKAAQLAPVRSEAPEMGALHEIRARRRADLAVRNGGPSVPAAGASMQNACASLERHPSEVLLPAVWAVNRCYLVYFAGALLPLVGLTFFLFGKWLSGFGTLLACVPAFCAAAWAAYRFGKGHCRRIFLERIKALLQS